MNQGRKQPFGTKQTAATLSSRGRLFARLLERDPPHNGPGAIGLCTTGRSDGPEAARVEPGEAAGRELVRRRRETGGVRLRQTCAIEHIRKFYADVDDHAFFNTEHPAEVRVFRGITNAAVVPDITHVRGPLAVWNADPRGLIQHDGLGRIEAMAIDVELVCMMGATVIHPVCGIQGLAGHPLRWSRSATQPPADGIEVRRSRPA